MPHSASEPHRTYHLEARGIDGRAPGCDTDTREQVEAEAEAKASSHRNTLQFFLIALGAVLAAIGAVVAIVGPDRLV